MELHRALAAPRITNQFRHLELEARVGTNISMILIVYHPEDDALYWKDSKFYVKSTPQVFQPLLRIIFDRWLTF